MGDQQYTCVEPDCGEPFNLTEKEERYFIDRGLYIPKRCHECRRKRREAKEAELAEANK